MANALKRCGSLTIWFDPGMAWAAKPTGKRGRQPVYSDAAVLTSLMMKVLFGLALRQTTGFVESLVGLDWDVPDVSTLSRRQKTLAVNIPHRVSRCPGKARYSAIDGRTTRRKGYDLSLKHRKRIEEAFGWAKTVGGMAQTVYRGVEKVRARFILTISANNLARLPRLLAA